MFDENLVTHLGFKSLIEKLNLCVGLPDGLPGFIEIILLRH
jgi:hypothetical protein